MSDAVVRMFAYGSNLSTRRLRARTRSAQALCVARLDGHTLRFHKRGRDGSAKADGRYTGRADDCVWGVVYEVAAAEMPALHAIEAGYDACEVHVRTHDGELMSVIAYRARQESIDTACAPLDWYVDYCVEGALEHGLPDDWVRELRRQAQPGAK